MLPLPLGLYCVMVLNDSLIFNVYRPPTYIKRNKTQHVFYMSLMDFEMHTRGRKELRIPLSVHQSIHAKCAWMIYFQSVHVVIKLLSTHIFIHKIIIFSDARLAFSHRKFQIISKLSPVCLFNFERS